MIIIGFNVVAFDLDGTLANTTAYLGAGEALDELRAANIRTAICTNKPERLARMLVDALGWSDKFDAIIGGDTLPVTKPHAGPLLEAISRGDGGRALYVGDSITDADTARAANIPFVAVSFGFRDRPVEQLGAFAVIDSFQDLTRIMLLAAKNTNKDFRNAQSKA